MEVEPFLDTPEMRRQQWAKLERRLEEAYTAAPYWRRRFAAAGIRPEDIRSWDDFARRVPIFTKADYRVLADENDGDMMRILADLMGAASRELVAIATTSGTTGDPTPYPLTPRDLHLWGELTRRAAWRAGLRPGDFVLQGFGLSMFLAGVPVCMALAEMGVSAIPVGAEGGTSQILKFAKLFRPRGMFCTPSLSEYMIESAEKTGSDLRDLGIEIMFSGGEPGAGLESVRSRIENAFGATLYDFAGGLGASCGVTPYGGMHWVVGDLAIMELVDPDTHEPIELEEGAEGLAIYTPLEAPGLLGIRQSNGDLMRVNTDPCECGQTGWRYTMIGRNDDMLKVKGVLVYPVAIEDVIQSFVPRLTGAFRIVLSEPPPRVVPPLRLRVERGVELQADGLHQIEEEIIEAMHRKVKIRPTIEWLEPFSLGRSTKKTQILEKDYVS
jgi:phenylacetate-CoA ligase